MSRRLVAVLVLVVVLLLGGLAVGLGVLSADGIDVPSQGSARPTPAPEGAPGATAVALKVGESRTVSLESNPTTGYTWELSNTGPAVQLVERHYESDSKALGGGGREVFTFRALQAGHVGVTLEYVRPWEKQPIKTVQYEFDAS